MIVYHASPHKNIKILHDNSYVTLFPHIAYIMGMYYVATNKPWNDGNLATPYRFGTKIHFKPKQKPDGIPALYKLEIEPSNIIMHDNFPFEFQIKKGVKVTKIADPTLLIAQSKKMQKIMDQVNF